jgi:enediyne biosynthesis protein E4
MQAVQKNVAYRQPPILYWNAEGGRFTPLGSRAGDLERPLVARGAPYADLDGDGDLDVVIVESGGPVQVFVNRIDRPEKSVRVRLVGSGRSNRDEIGAGVTARIGNRTQTQEVSGGQSYLSRPRRPRRSASAKREDRFARDPLARRPSGSSKTSLAALGSSLTGTPLNIS